MSVELNPGTGGAIVSTDSVSGQEVQNVKMMVGVAGSGDLVSNEAPLPTRTGSPGMPLVRYLDVDGDGGGSRAGNVDGSVTPVVLKLAPGAGEVFVITRLFVTIADSGTFNTSTYGALATLGTGLDFAIHDGVGVVVDLLNGESIKQHRDWDTAGGSTFLAVFGGGDPYVTVSWSFLDNGNPLRLVGDDGQYLAVTINDDLTGLTGHSFVAHGYVES